MEEIRFLGHHSIDTIVEPAVKFLPSLALYISPLIALACYKITNIVRKKSYFDENTNKRDYNKRE